MALLSNHYTRLLQSSQMVRCVGSAESRGRAGSGVVWRVEYHTRDISPFLKPLVSWVPVNGEWVKFVAALKLQKEFSDAWGRHVFVGGG